MRLSKLRDQVWDGYISVRLVLSQEETRNFHTSEYYVNVPRISYIHLYLDKALDYLRKDLHNPDEADSLEWWLEFEGVPLKWNWPIGLSYDLLTGLDPSKGYEERMEFVPWTLILHRKEYPKDNILSIVDKSTIKDYWLNQIKEASYVRYGNSKAILNLSKDDTESLWRSVNNFDMKGYCTLMDRQFADAPRNIPVKLYLPISNAVLQSPVSRNISDNEPQTVGTALNSRMPRLFPSKRTCVLARPLIHGVEIPLRTPLVGLLGEAMYPDGFLHICIVMMS